MPRNTREWCKREISAMENHCASIGIKAEKIIEIYKENHPKIADGFEIIADLQKDVYKILEGLQSLI